MVNQTLLGQTQTTSFCSKFPMIGVIDWIGVIFSNNLAMRFSNCDYLMSNTDPRTLSHLKSAF